MNPLIIWWLQDDNKVLIQAWLNGSDDCHCCDCEDEYCIYEELLK